MSDCGVCIYVDDSIQADFLTTKVRTASKEHKCCECDKTILKGERYENASGKNEGEMWNEKTCLVCAEIATAFYCDGRMFGGGLWDAMQENAFENMTTGCLDRLTTVAAKTELVRRWNEWKFR